MTLEKIKNENDLWSKIQSRADAEDDEAQQVVQAVLKTLNHFDIQDHREKCADSLLRMQALRKFNDIEWDQKDVRVVALVMMLEFFEKCLQ